MLSSGQLISGVYEVLEPIGEGGAGQIFLAWHKRLNKQVVIKRIKDHYVGRVNERGEADILKKLRHRYIPQVYDFIQMGSEVYTVMDYVDGNTLMDYIVARIRFEEVQLIKWVRQLLEALEYLHSQNPPVIHSDIKPSNIMIDRNGDICLIDFNISFDADDAKEIVGYSNGYASPEQVSRAQLFSSGGNYLGVHLDSRSDIFSLGASIYHIMTLLNPVRLMNKDIELWGMPLPYSDLFIDIIDKSLRRNINERYQSASDMLADLKSLKTRDIQYRDIRTSQLLYNIFFFLVIVLGVLNVFQGLTLRNEETLEIEYMAVVEEAGYDDYEQTIDDALSILNNQKYARLFGDRKQEKADLLYIIANAYFENDDYYNAIDFYKMAVETDQNNPEYFRDYAIASTRINEVDSAKAILEEAINSGINDVDLKLVQAEIASAEGDYSNAVADFREVFNRTDNSNTLGRAYVLCSRAYRRSGNLVEASNLLDEAYNKVDDMWRLRVLRENGSVCIQYIEENGTNINSDWINKADKCFYMLTNSGLSSVNDWLNYSMIKEMEGDFETAITVLKDVQEKYSEEYRLPMRISFYEIEFQLSKDENERDYSKALEYYNVAVDLYSKARNSGDSDDEMQRLEKTIQELYDKNWLEHIK